MFYFKMIILEIKVQKWKKWIATYEKYVPNALNILLQSKKVLKNLTFTFR